MTQGPRPRKQRGPQIPPGWLDPLRQQQPLVSRTWLLRAVGISFAVALLCAYLTMCLLFYQGGWQILFHPSHAVPSTPANVGMRFDDIHFNSTETGQPQLTGWWIPTEPGARHSSSILLYLHGASGSLSDTLPQLKMLHPLGINIFVIDYRGFGHSVNVHPSEATVSEDAAAAIAYLTDTRRLGPTSIVLYGEGLGANVAADVALRHPLVAALILVNPVPPALEQIAADRRTGLLPIRLLFADRFDLASKLKQITTPKLFLQTQTGPAGEIAPRYLQSLYSLAADPKRMILAQGALDVDGMVNFLEHSLPLHETGNKTPDPQPATAHSSETTR